MPNIDQPVPPLHSTFHELLSTEPQVVADYLVKRLADQFEQKHSDPADPYRDMGKKLLQLRNAIWQHPSDEYDPARKEGQRQIYNEIIGSFDNDAERGVFMKLVAQMGHMRQIANMAARDNFFAEEFTFNKDAAGDDKLIPGSPQYFIKNSGSKYKDILNAVNSAVFNPVFTAHPTNNSSLDSMQALGDVTKVITALQKERANMAGLIGRPAEPNQESQDLISAKLAELDKKIDAYLDAPLTPQNGEGHDQNLKAADETQNVLHFMGEIYHQMPATLKEYDDALSDKATAEAKALHDADPSAIGEKYNPLLLKPNYRFDSWGSSGDKDGNGKINATTTLQALIQHRKKGLELYLADVQAIGMSDEWQASLKDALDKVTQLQADVAAQGKANAERLELAGEQDAAALGLLTDEQFEAASKRLQANLAPTEKFLDDDPLKAEHGFDFEEFQNAISAAYHENANEPDRRQKALDLLRNTHIFGETFGRIEYRETAVEYTKAVTYVLEHANPSIGYPVITDAERITDEDRENPALCAEKEINLKAKEAQKVEILSDLLRPENAPKLRQMLKDQWAEIEAKGGEKAYSDSNEAIIYQSLKRMQLARDFPKAIVKQVLAECEEPSNALETKLLMELVGDETNAVRNKKGVIDEKTVKRPVMGIVPLFEDPQILKDVGPKMKAIIENPAYKQHLEDFLDAHPEERVIDPKTGEEALDRRKDDKGKLLRFTIEKNENGRSVRVPRPVLVQEVQLAHSDNSRRGGLAAARAYIYDAHRILDNLGEELGLVIHKFEGGSFSDPFRNGVRSVTGMIKEYGLFDYFKGTMQGGDLPNFFTVADGIKRFLGGVLSFCAQGLLKAIGLNKGADDVPTNSTDNITLPALKGTYDDHRPAFTDPSKIGAMWAVLQGDDPAALFKRSVATRANRKGVAFKHQQSEEFGDILYLDPNEVRTIVYSEIPQHNQMSPSWFGSYNLVKRLGAMTDVQDLSVKLRTAKKELIEENIGKKKLSAETKDQLKSLDQKIGDADSQSPELADAAMKAALAEDPAYKKQLSKDALLVSAAQEAFETRDDDKDNSEAFGQRGRFVQSVVSRFDKQSPEKLELAPSAETIDQAREQFKQVFSGDLNVEQANWKLYLESNNLSADTIRYMYRHSTPFRDEIDKMAYGLVMTDMEAAKTHHPEFADPSTPAGKYFKTEKLPEYVIAAATVHAAFTGKNLDIGTIKAQKQVDGKNVPRTETEMQNEFLDRVRHSMLTLKDMKPVQQEVESNIALLDFHNSLQADLRQKDAVTRSKREYELSMSSEGNVLHIQHKPLEGKKADKGQDIDLDGLDELDERTRERLIGGLWRDGNRTVETEIDKGQTVIKLGNFDPLPIKHDQWVKANDYLRPPYRTPEADEQREHLISVMVDVGRSAAHNYNPYLGDRAYTKEKLKAQAEHRAAQGMAIAS